MRLPAWLERFLFFVPLLAYIRCEEVFGIVGENLTFPVKIDQKITEIIWTKNRDKVAEWEGQNEPTYFTSLHNRGLLNKENGSLTIYNLESNDSGTYKLQYLDSVKNHDRTFILTVLPPPSEPKISCNSSGDSLVLNCTADFQKPLYYSWKLNDRSSSIQTQEVSIPKNEIDASYKATCSVKFSQTEKSFEISLTQCFTDVAGYGYQKRSRTILAVLLPLFIISAAILALYCVRGRAICRRGQAAQNNSPMHGLDNELDKEVIALQDKQTENNDVNQEDTVKEENSSLLAKHADDRGVNEGELTQNAEGGNVEYLSNSSSCNKEADQTEMEEKL